MNLTLFICIFTCDFLLKIFDWGSNILQAFFSMSLTYLCIYFSFMTSHIIFQCTFDVWKSVLWATALNREEWWKSIFSVADTYLNINCRFNRQKGRWSRESKRNKTGVINDPLDQPTVPAGSDCRLILKFWDGRTDTLCENSDHYQLGLVGLVDQQDRRVIIDLLS